MAELGDINVFVLGKKGTWRLRRRLKCKTAFAITHNLSTNLA